MIMRQGTWGYVCRTSSGTWVAASPMSSRLRRTSALATKAVWSSPAVQAMTFSAKPIMSST
jgi:hypothetical protein